MRQAKHQPISFDGHSSWEAYSIQFELLVELNQWGDKETATYLAVSLQGSALTALTNLPEIQRRSYPDVVDECLLGLDFLVSHESQVDLKDNILYIGEEEVPLTRPGVMLSQPQCYRAFTAETVSVALYFEAVLSTQVMGLGGNERWGIVEATGGDGQTVEGVLVGRTLVDLQRPEVPVRVMNLSNQPRGA